MNYEDLTKRIEKVEEKRDERRAQEGWGAPEGFWDGYVAALRDIRNDIKSLSKAKVVNMKIQSNEYTSSEREFLEGPIMRGCDILTRLKVRQRLLEGKQ